MTGPNRQLVINMIAGLCTFVVGLAIRFILTPFIVKSLGPEAYGYIGLCGNLLSYSSLITIALNSMAGRFVTIEYSSGNIDGANIYFSSVFFSNLVLACVIVLLSAGCVLWLDKLINIPAALVLDVKILFGFSALNSIIALISSVFNVSPFIKNRLDLSNIFGILGNILNVALLYFAYSNFLPRLWYLSLAGTITTVYSAIVGWALCAKLTPDLVIKRTFYNYDKVKKLIKSGVWNLVTKLGDILGRGLDLIIANVCIGSLEMGIFAITKNVPFLILSLF